MILFHVRCADAFTHNNIFALLWQHINSIVRYVTFKVTRFGSIKTDCTISRHCENPPKWKNVRNYLTSRKILQNGRQKTHNSPLQTKHWYCSKHEVNNGKFFPTRFPPDISLTLANFRDTARLSDKWSTCVHTHANNVSKTHNILISNSVTSVLSPATLKCYIWQEVGYVQQNTKSSTKLSHGHIDRFNIKISTNYQKYITYYCAGPTRGSPCQ